MFVVVDDANQFHVANMEANRDHYPLALRLLVNRGVQDVGAGVTYLHAHSPHYGRVKYGVRGEAVRFA